MKRCRICNSSFKPKTSLQVVCTPICAIELSRQKQRSKVKEAYTEYLKSEIRKPKKASGQKTISQLMKEVQIVCNKYIRMRDKGQPCISCGKVMINNVQAGHFFSSGAHKAVTFDTNNIHAQCVKCNMHQSGNLIPYRENLIKKIGLEAFTALEEKSKLIKRYDRNELRELKDFFSQKINELEKA